MNRQNNKVDTYMVDQKMQLSSSFLLFSKNKEKVYKICMCAAISIVLKEIPNFIIIFNNAPWSIYEYGRDGLRVS